MRRHGARVAAVAMVLTAGGCGADATPRAPVPSTAVPSTAAPSTAVPFVLRTHCGISEAKFEGRYYRAVTPLSDGQGNPPRDWDNPEQEGTMRLLSDNEAEFRDSAGHVVLFRVRPGATAFASRCPA